MRCSCPYGTQGVGVTHTFPRVTAQKTRGTKERGGGGQVLHRGHRRLTPETGLLAPPLLSRGRVRTQGCPREKGSGVRDCGLHSWDTRHRAARLHVRTKGDRSWENVKCVHIVPWNQRVWRGGRGLGGGGRFLQGQPYQVAPPEPWKHSTSAFHLWMHAYIQLSLTHTLPPLLPPKRRQVIKSTPKVNSFHFSNPKNLPSCQRTQVLSPRTSKGLLSVKASRIIR